MANGFLYALSYDRKSVYRISLADTSQVRQFTPGIERFHMMACGIYPHRGGGILTEFLFQATNATGSTENRRTRSVIYKDGEWRCDLGSYTTSFWSIKDF